MIITKISEIVTEKDIVMFLLHSDNKENLDEITLSEVTKRLEIVEDSKSLKESANLMLDKKISRIILINQAHMPNGILSMKDLLKISRDFGVEETVVDNTVPGMSVLFSRKGFLSKTGF